MDVHIWNALATQTSFDHITWLCGDHGTEEEETVHARAGRGRISAVTTLRACPAEQLER